MKKTSKKNTTKTKQKDHTTRGIKFVITNRNIAKVVLNALRSSLHEIFIRYGDPDKHPFTRPKGLTSDALFNIFGFTFYFRDKISRDKALKEINACMPQALIRGVTMRKTRRKTTEKMHLSLVGKVYIHNAA